MSETLTVQRNTSCLFLLPLLKVKEEVRVDFNSYGFINTYMESDTLNYEFNPLYILFKPDFNMAFYNFSRQLERNQNHIETLDLEGGHVLFVFKIPNRFEHDLDKIKSNRYSCFSPEFKACFPTTVYKQETNGKVEAYYTMYHHVFAGAKSTYRKFDRNEELLKC